ncbi:quinone oxidoreductase family protein [Naasia lichenicola]|uniref:NADP-dependent oxidoreductase n=1 Tax=Naasia lichenicola TaxID=2565933 RepID=A0A4S4FR83_9MICO|nr:NADP-dependent oxidoreductase [Naasia lichenicola]THG32874.1 NADP-dependent oxidoreductase [Naasia lichenicola]
MAHAVVATEYGAPSTLSIVEVEVPAPEAGKVTVAVKAAGLNPYDWKVFTGLYGTDPAKLPLRVGNEAAGVVTAISDGASTEFGPVSVGDEVVISNAGGLLATEVNVRTRSLTPKPAGVTFEQAAGLLLAGTTAWDLVEHANPKPGDTVVVHGASGGVGFIAAQLAVAKGARVLGTASARHSDALTAIGVEPVLYGDGLQERLSALAPSGIASAMDAVGTQEALDASIALVEKARIFTVAAEPDQAAELGITRLPAADSNAIRSASGKPLLDLVAAGKLRVVISDIFPLSEVSAAYDLVKSGHAGGKVIVTL